MHTFEQVHDLMAKIGPQLELDAVSQFDDEQSWVLFVDDDLAITVDSDFDAGKLILSSDLVSPPEETRLATYELLLQYNCQWPETGGLRMGLDEPGGTIVQMFDLPLAGLDLERLVTVVQNFIDQTELWRKILTDGVQGEVAVVGEDAADSDAAPGIRV